METEGAPANATLLVGFDSAWTAGNSGALVGALRLNDGSLRGLGAPEIACYDQAERVIKKWQNDHRPTATLILLDQPTIVNNDTGQRPVESLVGSPVARRYGGMQPANTSRKDMFGRDAPVWKFLSSFGGPGDPLQPIADTRVFETYPVLTMVALSWVLPHVSRPRGRLPKYNPARRKTFSMTDWQFVCRLASAALRDRGIQDVALWLDEAARYTSPRKSDQDRLDACLCLLVALCLAERSECLMVGNLDTGYIVVPCGSGLRAELDARCRKTGREPLDWVRSFKLNSSQATQ